MARLLFFSMIPFRKKMGKSRGDKFQVASILAHRCRGLMIEASNNNVKILRPVTAIAISNWIEFPRYRHFLEPRPSAFGTGEACFLGGIGGAQKRERRSLNNYFQRDDKRGDWLPAIRRCACVDVTSIKRINYNGVPCFLANESVAFAFVQRTPTPYPCTSPFNYPRFIIIYELPETRVENLLRSFLKRSLERNATLAVNRFTISVMYFYLFEMQRLIESLERGRKWKGFF